jgi:hypothetical protein
MELEMIFLAVVTGILGVIITFILIFVCQFFGIDMLNNIWLLAIPVVLAIALNIWFIELYHKYKKK